MKTKLTKEKKKALDTTVERIALFSNPVELVNNMYGCHPDDGDGDGDYFTAVYKLK